MDESERPLASGWIEEQARAMFGEGLPAEEYAARWAHTIAGFSLGRYRYRDPRVDAWIRALAAILFREPGAPDLDALRQRFLTAELD